MAKSKSVVFKDGTGGDQRHEYHGDRTPKPIRARSRFHGPETLWIEATKIIVEDEVCLGVLKDPVSVATSAQVVWITESFVLYFPNPTQCLPSCSLTEVHNIFWPQPDWEDHIHPTPPSHLLSGKSSVLWLPSPGTAHSRQTRWSPRTAQVSQTCFTHTTQDHPYSLPWSITDASTSSISASTNCPVASIGRERHSLRTSEQRRVA